MPSDGTEYALSPSQQRAWLSYMRVYHRLEYEMNKHLQTDCGLSLGDYTVLNALSHAPGHQMQLTALANTIGWERSRLSHHLLRMTGRDLVERVASRTDGRGTDVLLTSAGWALLQDAAPTHAAWVRQHVFSDLDGADDDALAAILGTVHESLLRDGTLPRPESS